MKALFINPSAPKTTFWSHKHALEFAGVKAQMPPLGLLTVAAMLPDTWTVRLVDMDVHPLTDEDLNWAEIAFIGGMCVQAKSMEEVIRRCRELKIRTCGGGAIYASLEHIARVDHLFLGEVEQLMPEFLDDLAAGHAKNIYRAETFPDLSLTPIPRWDLIDFSNYLTVPMQISRGCPYNCDFCHVRIIYGKKPRSKSVSRVLSELDSLYEHGWRGTVFFADDNFIGRRDLAKQILSAMISWQSTHGYPFHFIGQASVDVGDDPQLPQLLQQAGFEALFIGIESTVAASLSECNKKQNLDCNLFEVVRLLQEHSMEVLGGFIVGFDSDPPTIFDDLYRFIDEAALVSAMVGVLAAPYGTELFRRMVAENRLIRNLDGDSIANFSGMNVVPAMGWDRLLDGYKKLLAKLYEPAPYYQRALRFLSRYKINPWLPGGLPSPAELRIILRMLWGLGVKDSDRRSFWRFMAELLMKYPQLLPHGINIVLAGYHYRLISRRFIETEHDHASVEPLSDFSEPIFNNVR
ncbi:MAG: radical SAM protein [Syntrophobacteraceae bacterium]|jgi:radical SAM superfamily enzyme YgiQ (UPF0313 family)